VWFRVAMAGVVAATVVDRLGVLECFFSDAGILPVDAWREETGGGLLLWVVVPHAWSGSLAWQGLLSGAQLVLAWTTAATSSATTTLWRRLCTVALSLWLYASATLRFVSSAYILDRYVLVELLFLACAPSAEIWEETAAWSFLWRAQLSWIYLDAGLTKLGGPGWTADADLPAVDAYLRHTFAADVLRRYVLSPRALRLATPAVPWVEILAPNIAHAASLLRPRRVAFFIEVAAIAAVIALHVGVALCMNGAGLLGVAACAAWVPLLPDGEEEMTIARHHTHPPQQRRRRWSPGAFLRIATLVAYVGACATFALQGRHQCVDAKAAPFATLFHNRWNVFAGSDDTIVFEIMPARLRDGNVVDLWRRGDPVSWDVPARAPRRGRWRTFPMIGQADAPPDRLNATYFYFCHEWNSRASVRRNDSLQVLHFHAYMLRSSIFDTANVTKRLLHVQRCVF